MKIQENCSLQEKHTFHIPVKTRRYIEYDTVEELQSLVVDNQQFAKNKFIHIGAGSNLLFLGDYNGTVLHSAVRFIERIDEDADTVLLRAGSGVVWDDFVTYCVENNLCGAENLSFIPGEVGASAVQNIGAYGVEVKDLIEKVETIEVENGKMRIFSNSECRYGYRDSIFKGKLKGQYIVTAVQYRLQKKAEYRLDYGNLREALSRYDAPTLADVRQVIDEIRGSKLPDTEVLGNAGSFFKNPVVPTAHYHALKETYPDMPHYPVDETSVKLPAGWLIDRAGWRGRAHGNAAVYEKQSLVLVNRGGATAQDVVELAELICQSVKEKYNVDLYPEVNYIE